MRENAPYFSELATKEVVAIFERMRAEMPGFIAVSLVDVRSGTTLVSHSVREDFDLSAAGVFNSEIAKLETKAQQTFGSEATFDEILLTLSDQIHILKMVDCGAAFVYLAVDRTSTNLAAARYSLNYSTDLATRQSDRGRSGRHRLAAGL